MKNDLKGLRRLSALLLIAVALVWTFTLFGCVSTAPTAEESAEVLQAVNELYEKSLILNEYIFGAGMEVSDPDADPNGKVSPLYVEVAESMPYKTEADFERAILSVYSESYYEASLVFFLFEGYEDQTVKDPRYRERNGVLQFDVTSEPKFSDLSGRFDLSTAVVVSVSSETASVECNYTRGDYSAVCTLTLERTSNGWRFATPTF